MKKNDDIFLETKHKKHTKICIIVSVCLFAFLLFFLLLRNNIRYNYLANNDSKCFEYGCTQLYSHQYFFDLKYGFLSESQISIIIFVSFLQIF